MLRTYGTSSQADSVLLNRERTSLQRWKYISERGVVLDLMPMAALLLDRTRTSRNNIIFSVNTFSFILPSTMSIDPLSLQDLPVKNRVKMSVLKNNANNSSNLLLPTSGPLWPHFFQRHNRKMHLLWDASPPHHPQLQQHREQPPPTPPPKPPAHHHQQQLYSCAIHHRRWLWHLVHHSRWLISFHLWDKAERDSS